MGEHYSMDGYAGHQIPLVSAVMQTAGDVLECGTGLYSTRLLNVLCRDRGLVSADTDGAWLDQFRDLESPRHEFHVVGLKPSSWQEFVEKIKVRSFDVALIDQSPSEARIQTMLLLRSRTKFFVIHDSNVAAYGYEPVFAQFKHRFTYKVEALHTTVVSDHEEFALK